MTDLNTIRQEIAKLRDGAVTASTIKSQMEEQIRTEVGQICNILPDCDGKDAVLASAEALKADISAETMEKFKTSLGEFIDSAQKLNDEKIAEIENTISKWKEEVNNA